MLHVTPSQRTRGVCTTSGHSRGAATAAVATAEGGGAGAMSFCGRQKWHTQHTHRASCTTHTRILKNFDMQTNLKYFESYFEKVFPGPSLALKTLLIKNLKYFNREFECSFDPKPKIFQCIFNEFSIIATCSMLPRPTLTVCYGRGAHC